MTASTPLVVTFAIYLLAMVAIGVIAWRSTKSFDDYILGGRSLGSYVPALSAGASGMSGCRPAKPGSRATSSLTTGLYFIVHEPSGYIVVAAL